MKKTKPTPLTGKENGQRVFAVITLPSGYKYQTGIMSSWEITNEIVATANRHAEKYYTSRVFDADFYDWKEIMDEQQTNPEVVPQEYLPKLK